MKYISVSDLSNILSPISVDQEKLSKDISFNVI